MSCISINIIVLCLSAQGKIPKLLTSDPFHGIGHVMWHCFKFTHKLSPSNKYSMWYIKSDKSIVRDVYGINVIVCFCVFSHCGLLLLGIGQYFFMINKVKPP